MFSGRKVRLGHSHELFFFFNSFKTGPIGQGLMGQWLFLGTGSDPAAFWHTAEGLRTDGLSCQAALNRTHSEGGILDAYAVIHSATPRSSKRGGGMCGHSI